MFEVRTFLLYTLRTRKIILDVYYRLLTKKQAFAIQIKNHGKPFKRNFLVYFCLYIYSRHCFPYRYRRKPKLYGKEAQFGIYLACSENGIIRVGDPIRILREDKNF
jgi:hypothetical protein